MYRKAIQFLLLAGVLFTSNLNLNGHAYYGGRPLFVEISTSWCFACKILKPTIEELKNQYGSEVEFVLLDATNEATIKQAEQIAYTYGIEEFFKNNRYAFPTVAIFSSSGILEKIILGANKKEAYVAVLDKLTGDVQIAENKPSRPEEPDFEEIKGGRPDKVESSTRPDEPKFLERPLAISSSGRPPELTFWVAGGPIPLYAYYQFFVLPECSGNNNIICSSQIDFSDDKPVFKPWTPFATRDEKGFGKGVVKKI